MATRAPYAVAGGARIAEGVGMCDTGPFRLHPTGVVSFPQHIGDNPCAGSRRVSNMADESNAAHGNLARFQTLLRELFQFDCADLEIGIYRIMNHKRDAIERFITTTLLRRRQHRVAIGRVGAAGRLRQPRWRMLAETWSPCWERAPWMQTANLPTLSAMFRWGERTGEPRLTPAQAACFGSVADSIYKRTCCTFFSRYYDELRDHLLAPVLTQRALRHPLPRLGGVSPLGK